jgi:isoleucyl-tRNA synthetase
VDLARTLRGSAGLKARQPLARLWLALPGGTLAERDGLLELIREEVNVKAIELIGDESELVERRVKPLLPKIGKRLGGAIPAVMAAARSGEFEIAADGSVTLAGVTLAADEVEIQASPRPGTAVAHVDGLVVVIDTELSAELRAEGDARELQRAVQELRRDANLALDARIDLWLDGLPPSVAPHLPEISDEVLAASLPAGRPPATGVATKTVQLAGGRVEIALRARAAGAAATAGTRVDGASGNGETGDR